MDSTSAVEMRGLASLGKREARPSADYGRAPLLVYWEVTQACPLACRHCRAEAMPHRHPLELSHEEGRLLLRQIAEFDDPLPHLVITGGDPLSRPDLLELIAYSRGLDFGVSITPSATQNLDGEMIRRLRACGIQSMALSLDGSAPERHDALRGVMGCYGWTLEGAQRAVEEGFSLQINTLVAAETLEDLEAIAGVVQALGVSRWSLFFLVSVGRGRQLQEITPHQAENLMHWLYDLSQEAPFAVKTTEAPHYRRVALTRMRAEGTSADSIRRTLVHHGFGVRDGNGILFVSHTGAIYPAGFLPLTAGQIRRHHVVQIYRDSPLFRSLRDPDQFKGKCGRCEFKTICGGSRARAYAHTGDPLESDPLCPYQPQRREP